MALDQVSHRSGGASFPASRVEADTRVEVGFFGHAGSRLFGSLSSPQGEPLGGVVICPPLHADFPKNYRNEVLLARALAREGFAVLRFHYRGQGHSDGDPDRITLRSLKEDTLAAVELLMTTTHVDRLGLVGCRLGGFVAATSAASSDDVPLTLWEPVVDPSRYLREAIRARLIAQLGDLETERTSAEALVAQLDHDGFVDIHGYPIHLGLVRSLERRTLGTELGSRPRPILLVEVGRGRDLGREYASLVGDWSSRGFPVEVHHITGDVGWWFRGAHQDREHVDRLADEAVGRTVAWMRTNLAAAGVAR